MSSASPSLSIQRCFMDYRTADPDEWIHLPGGSDNKVRNVVFDDGLNLVQATSDNMAQCTVKFSVTRTLSIDISSDSRIEVTCDRVHDLIFISSAKTDKGISDSFDEARQLPLATLSKSFAGLRIVDVKRGLFKGHRIQPLGASASGISPTSEAAHLKAQLGTLLFAPSAERVKHPTSKDPIRSAYLTAEIPHRRRKHLDEGSKLAHWTLHSKDHPQYHQNKGQLERRKDAHAEIPAKIAEMEAELATLEMTPVELAMAGITRSERVETHQETLPAADSTDLHRTGEQKNESTMATDLTQANEGIVQEVKTVAAQRKGLEEKLAELSLRGTRLLEQLGELDDNVER